MYEKISPSKMMALFSAFNGLFYSTASTGSAIGKPNTLDSRSCPLLWQTRHMFIWVDKSTGRMECLALGGGELQKK